VDAKGFVILSQKVMTLTHARKSNVTGERSSEVL